MLRKKVVATIKTPNHPLSLFNGQRPLSSGINTPLSTTLSATKNLFLKSLLISLAGANVANPEPCDADHEANGGVEQPERFGAGLPAVGGGPRNGEAQRRRGDVLQRESVRFVHCGPDERVAVEGSDDVPDGDGSVDPIGKWKLGGEGERRRS